MTAPRSRSLSLGVFVCIAGIWLAFAGLPASAQVPVIQAAFPKATTEIAIEHWRFVGPFRFDQKEIEIPDAEKLPVGLNRDYLAHLGLKETVADAPTFASAKEPQPGIKLDERFRNELISATSKTKILDLGIGSNTPTYAIAYLAVVIESAREQEIAIAAGADDNMKIWLNRELILGDPVVTHRFIKKFRNLAGARLNKGSNFLLVKVGNLTGDWRVMVTLFPHDRALQLAGENAISSILTESVLAVGQPLVLRGDLLPEAAHFQLDIADSHHRVVDSAGLSTRRQSTRALDQLQRDELYFCRVSVAGHVIEKPFYYGNPDAGLARLSEKAARFKGGREFVYADLQAQLGRLQHILKPENRSSDFWDQKVAASFAEVESNLAALADSVEAFLHAPGTHLRGYRSSVDGQVLNYWVHVPPKAEETGKPIPLVIVLPWTALTNLPFLESYQMAAFEETERYRTLGDEYGFAVVQVWGRGSYLGGTAIWRADVFEALDAVRQDYAIDLERIYLVGDCEGGRQALLLGERYPDRFAAIAVEGPITIVRNNPAPFALWAQYASPVTGVANLVDIPVLINHEENDDAPPFQFSETFASEARRAGVDITLVRSEGGFHGFSQDPTGVKRSLFEFFKGKQRKASAQQPGDKAIRHNFGKGRGPIEEAFGSSVLVVEGTTGNPSQRSVVHALVQELLGEWKRAYFVDCPTKFDISVTELELQKYNLILVGDKETNFIIARMAERLPLHAAVDRVSLSEKTYEGSHLGYEFIAPNPLNPARQIIVVGMNQWATVNWRLHPSRDGMCDYFIFDLAGPAARLRDEGYFDDSVWRAMSAATLRREEKFDDR